VIEFSEPFFLPVFSHPIKLFRKTGMKELEYIWMNGKLVKWQEAKIHVLSHVAHYGSSFFEGIRCYKTDKGSAILALSEHMKRLIESAKIYRADCGYSVEQLNEATIELIKANKLQECYIRPLVYRGYSQLGINPLTCPVDTAIAVWEWGKYLGEESAVNGIDVKVSTWSRNYPNSLPSVAKAGGGYLNSQLAKMEALSEGYSEAIMLDSNGFVSEGTGENIFVIKDGKVFTPSISSSILTGITRGLAIKIAKENGFEVLESSIPRGLLYTADEIFLTGTAAEITPIRTVDKIQVGIGKRGPITEKIQNGYFDIIRKGNDKFGVLTFI